MALQGNRAFVGFGFGAIQAGLFLYEAARSGAFGRLVVAEVVPEAVAALRRAGGRYTLNLAQSDRVERCDVGPVEAFDPAVASDRAQLVEAVAAAEEIATAVPGVEHYAATGPASLHRVLAEGLRLKVSRGGPRAVVYAAENHTRAAEILESHVLGELSDADREATRRQVRFLNTVIGKMSGTLTDAGEVRSRGLAPVTPSDGRAFLVEAFNRILISRIDFGGPGGEAGATAFRRGLAVFEEKADLQPFAEAKLYGHNATHALAAYLGALVGAERIADLPRVAGFMEFVRAAMVEESGAALVRKYAGTDPLFTPEGFRVHADDLLRRMTNPFLGDTVERVGRQPARKLGWDDRLVGTMRLALSQSVEPRRYALGAAAALAQLDRSLAADPSRTRATLTALWSAAAPTRPEAEAVLDRVDRAAARLKAWLDAGRPRLDRFA
jgi:mannitol-1-phosphate 5-dehydrogenase